MAKAPMKYEGSKKDMKMDAMMAKKTGMSKKAWESSPQDKSMDKAGQAAMMMRKGGGKMSIGAAKKGMGAEKRASGGKVGSRGATQRGFGAEKH
jgi:hypothetical protein